MCSSDLHAEVYHIKKENIGLIEVMGLAVLPARLKTEMKLVGEELVKGTKDIAGIDAIRSHADWYRELVTKYPSVTADTVGDILQEEIGQVFKTVLTHAGVYKRNEEGMAAFDRFAAAVSED